MIAMRTFYDLAIVSQIDQMRKRKSGRKFFPAIYANILLIFYAKALFYADYDNEQHGKRAHGNGKPKSDHIVLLIPRYWT